MKRILDFCKAHKYAIIWTLFYVFIVWAIMRGLFHFDIFSRLHWHRIVHVRLHGFPGLVFGLMVLSAIPLYLATTMIIIRTRAPLFQIRIPKIFSRKPDPAPDPQPSPEPKEIPQPQPQKFPRKLPTELRPAFVRAQSKVPLTQRSVFNRIELEPSSVPKSSDTELPLPTDFEISAQPDNDIPVFQDIDFDTPCSGVATATSDIPMALAAAGHPVIQTQGEVYITDTYAIVVHDDPEFWIADQDNWFAVGRQKPSPILALTQATQGKDLIPIIILLHTNIMNIDELRSRWESQGIRVLESIQDL